jgi:hypothetical protein
VYTTTTTFRLNVKEIKGKYIHDVAEHFSGVHVWRLKESELL